MKPILPLLLLLSFLLQVPLTAQEDPYEIPMEEEETVLTVEDLEDMAERIMPRVERLRGLEWKYKVPVGINTPSEFSEFAQHAVEDEYGKERLQGLTTFSRLFGIIGVAQDYEEVLMGMLENSVGGYFDPEEDKFYMISTFNKGAMAEYIMAHELCHALDHQHLDLEAVFEAVQGNSDREFAMRCVVEGSASAVGNAYLMKGIASGWLDAADLMDADMMAAMTDGMDDVPVYLIANLAMPYLDGTTFLMRKTSDELLVAMMMEPDQEDVERAFLSPPLSSEQILHPEKYWNEELWDPPVEVELKDLSAKLGADWSLVLKDTLGEFSCAMLTMKRPPSVMDVSMGTARLAAPDSDGWGGDTVMVYRNTEDDRAMMHWRSVWDTEEDAEEFAIAMRNRGMTRAPMLREILLQGNRVDAYFSTESAIKDLETLK